MSDLQGHPHFDPRTRSHRGDPDTSREAAAKMARTGKALAQQKQARAAVYTHPGKTSKELAKITALDRHMLARRLPELKDVHSHYARGGVTWWPGDREHCPTCNRAKEGKRQAEIFSEQRLPD